MKPFVIINIALLFIQTFALSAYGASEDSRVVAIQHKERKVQYHIARIAYPNEARRKHITGEGLVQVSFNDQGRPTKVVMVKSTGSNLLDTAMTQDAKAHWTSSTGNPSTLQMRFKFALE